MTFKSISYLVIGFCALVSLAAAEPAKPQTAGTVHFRTLGVNINAEDIVYKKGEKYLPITLSEAVRSSFYDTTSANGILTFYRMVTGPEGKPVPVSVGQVNVSGLGPRVLLLFLPDSAQAKNYTVRAFADNAKVVPPGGYRFMNLTAINVGIVLGGKKVIIAPGGEAVASDTPAGGSAEVQVAVYGVVGEAAHIAYSNIWLFDPQCRFTVLITPSAKFSTGAQVRRFPESIEQIPADEEPKPAGAK
jgi:hypothetical protein